MTKDVAEEHIRIILGIFYTIIAEVFDNIPPEYLEKILEGELYEKILSLIRIIAENLSNYPTIEKEKIINKIKNLEENND